MKKENRISKIVLWLWGHPVLTGAALFGLYTLCFFLIEMIDQTPATLMYSSLDHLIPFSKYSVIFYCSWHLEFGILLLSFIYRKDINGYWLTMFKLLAGMFLILTICVLFPSMVDLRPATVEGSDIFAWLTRAVYILDDSRNVFPSGHVFGALIMAAGWCRLAKKPWQKVLAWSWNIGIIASTMLLKQHSVIDVIGGILLAVLVNYAAEFVWIWLKSRKLLPGKSHF